MRIFRHLLPLSVASLALAAPMIAMPTPSFAQIDISITLAPPPLPVYVQPPLPELGYIWTPGYWSWGQEGYYWVPGTWILPPQAGYLWTPGYWAWRDGHYFWSAGYWGPHIGYYGGINYGYGYTGYGYYGGRWDHGNFRYNASANNFGGRHVTNIYRQTIVNNNTTRVSFNGGRGGVRAQPRGNELVAARDQHVPASSQQTQHAQAAAGNHALLSSVNRGRPPVAASSHPGDFSAGTARARGATRTPDEATPRTAAAPATQRQPRAAAPQERSNAAAPQVERQQQRAVAPAEQQQPRQQHERAARPAEQQRQAAPQQQRQAQPQAAPRPERAAAPAHQEARPQQQRPQPQARPAEQPHPDAAPAAAAPEEHHEGGGGGGGGGGRERGDRH